LTDLILTVTENESGERVDAFVARSFAVPRSRAQEALRGGHVTLGGKTVRPSHKLETGDVIAGTVDVKEVTLPAAEDIPIDVRYEDERVLVISKPAGLVTHPAGGHETGTLVNALLGLGGTLSGEGGMRPGIVHRLDKDTSGLLLVARDDDAHSFLTAALKARDVGRTYLALVRGLVVEPSGTVDAPLGRNEMSRRKMAVVADGRDAVTHYRVLGRGPRSTYLEVRLETGRTHQIRVHLSHLGHPVLGDPVYGGRSELSQKLGLKRPFLHACKLVFPHPDGGERVVEDPLPGDLKRALGMAEVELVP
jgi:23S rRNA pseudouridine1911/1915/1917 synthase